MRIHVDKLTMRLELYSQSSVRFATECTAPESPKPSLEKPVDNGGTESDEGKYSMACGGSEAPSKKGVVLPNT